jgi:hypothetical protein
VTPWREWLAVYDELTPRLILILAPTPGACWYAGFGLPTSLPVWEVGMCKAEPSRSLQSEPWYGPGLRSPPKSGTWARLAPTDLSVGIMGLGRSNGAAAYEEGRSSRHGLRLVSEKWARWGPRIPGPITPFLNLEERKAVSDSSAINTA